MLETKTAAKVLMPVGFFYIDFYYKTRKIFRFNHTIFFRLSLATFSRYLE